MPDIPEPDPVRIAAEISRHIRVEATDSWYHPDGSELPEALAADLTAAGWRWYDTDAAAPLPEAPITGAYLNTVTRPDTVEEFVGVAIGMATAHDWWPGPDKIFDEQSALAIAAWTIAGINAIHTANIADEAQETEGRTVDNGH